MIFLPEIFVSRPYCTWKISLLKKSSSTKEIEKSSSRSRNSISSKRVGSQFPKRGYVKNFRSEKKQKIRHKGIFDHQKIRLEKPQNVRGDTFTSEWDQTIPAHLLISYSAYHKWRHHASQRTRRIHYTHQYTCTENYELYNYFLRIKIFLYY